MAQVVVTGATGTLGREVLPVAIAAGHKVLGISRHDHSEDADEPLARRAKDADEPLARRAKDDVRWYRCDLLAGDGLAEALDGADTIVHCATQPTGRKDVTSTQNLLAAARQAGVGHLIYVSIVGVEHIPLPYYKTKLAVEHVLAASDVGYTVLRATQFHDLIARIFSAQRLSPVLLALHGVDFQPIDTRDVATRLVQLIDEVAEERAPDIGGPEVRSHADLARAYLEWRGSRRPVAAVPVPGAIAAGYRSGAHLAPQNRVGTIRFEDYLRRS